MTDRILSLIKVSRTKLSGKLEDVYEIEIELSWDSVRSHSF